MNDTLKKLIHAGRKLLLRLEEDEVTFNEATGAEHEDIREFREELDAAAKELFHAEKIQ